MRLEAMVDARSRSGSGNFMGKNLRDPARQRYWPLENPAGARRKA